MKNYLPGVPPQDKQHEEAWQVTEALWLQLRDESRAHHVLFYLADPATRDQMLPDLADREAFMRQIGVEDLDYPNRRLKDFAERNQIGLIPLSKRMADYSATHHAYLNGFKNSEMGIGHYNSLGHEVIAQGLYEGVCGSTAILPSQGPR